MFATGNTPVRHTASPLQTEYVFRINNCSLKYYIYPLIFTFQFPKRLGADSSETEGFVSGSYFGGSFLRNFVLSSGDR